MAGGFANAALVLDTGVAVAQLARDESDAKSAVPKENRILFECTMNRNNYVQGEKAV
jgi:hypothetical protein